MTTAVPYDNSDGEIFMLDEIERTSEMFHVDRILPAKKLLF